MASGLVALLDDIAAITKLAAASLDDIAAATGKVGLKAAGVVIDDTAVTPRYVVGLKPERELPIIAKIALGSLRNKILILLPAALALSAFAPWAVTPLLMLGGAYLSFEATEKIVEAVFSHAAPADADTAITDPAALETAKVKGAVRTDLILSAEIMAIALGDVADRPILAQAVVLALVGLAITVGVYGVVAIIVKVDDIGIYLAREGSAVRRAIGRSLVIGMPWIMSLLSVVGTAAMLWVGGGILVHGLEGFGLGALPHALLEASEAAGRAMPAFPATARWLVTSAGAAVVGVAVGGAVVLLLQGWSRLRGSSHAEKEGA